MLKIGQEIKLIAGPGKNVNLAFHNNIAKIVAPGSPEPGKNSYYIDILEGKMKGIKHAYIDFSANWTYEFLDWDK